VTTIEEKVAGKKGDSILLFGSKGTDPKRVKWHRVINSKAGFDYMMNCPKPKSSTKQRVEYYVQYLEHADDVIARDAFCELSDLPFETLRKFSRLFSKDKLEKWVLGDNVMRRSFYGSMLGICGDEQSARILKSKILEPNDEIRFGIDGLMVGFLLLTGEEGLQVLDEHKLKKTDIPYSEAYSAMQAIRFMWSEGDGLIKKNRLRQSMRILLDWHELCDLVLGDLGRWEDWAVQDRIVALYDKDKFNIPSIRRAIVRYLLRSAGEFDIEPVKDAANEPAHRKQARKYLAMIQKKDPETVKAARRFYLPDKPKQGSKPE
jgi:hypothetical protein